MFEDNTAGTARSVADAEGTRLFIGMSAMRSISSVKKDGAEPCRHVTTRTAISLYIIRSPACAPPCSAEDGAAASRDHDVLH
jgi:hypothetical protein